eukprot:15349345-Ditylum_brightwellii.AAC.1
MESVCEGCWAEYCCSWLENKREEGHGSIFVVLGMTASYIFPMESNMLLLVGFIGIMEVLLLSSATREGQFGSFCIVVFWRWARLRKVTMVRGKVLETGNSGCWIVELVAVLLRGGSLRVALAGDAVLGDNASE